MINSPSVRTADGAVDATDGNISPKKRRVEVHDLVWLLSAAATVFTTKYLMVNGYPFPMRILVAHILVALISTALRPAQRISTHTGTRYSALTLFWSFLHIIAMTGSLIFAYQAFFHLQNYVLLTMVLTLSWPDPLRGFGFKVALGWNPIVESILRFILFVGCVACMYLYENHLSWRGVDTSLLAAASFAIAQMSTVMGAQEYLPGLKSQPISIRTCSLLCTLPVAAIVLYMAGEASPKKPLYPNGLLLTVLVNSVIGAVTLFSGTPFKCLIWANDELHAVKSDVPGLLLVGIVAIGSAFLDQRRLSTGFVQFLAYILTTAASIHHAIASPSISAVEEDTRSVELQDLDDRVKLLRTERYGMDPKRWPRTWPRYAFLCILPMLFIVYQRTHPAVPVSTIQFPQPTDANRTLDVVFARYAEKAEEIAAFTKQLLGLPIVGALAVRVVVYNKGNETDDFGALASVTDNLVIRNRPNVGGEGETYLSHILSESDDLAPYTLFIQGEPHEPGQLQKKLQDYFVPETGFLSLSYTGSYCYGCDRCVDNSDWREKPEMLREIYEKTNEGACEDISLTYRGQFLVSRERVRKVDRQLLSDLRERLLHMKRFGYMLERLWGVIFQCPTISLDCPSLESTLLGNMGPGGRADCQCLDR